MWYGDKEVHNMLERKIRDEVKRLYSDTRYLTLKSIRTALNCKERGDWAAMRNTRLYNLNSVCYCLMLEVIAAVTE